MDLFQLIFLFQKWPLEGSNTEVYNNEGLVVIPQDNPD